jgi:hypothetical protein
VWHIISIFHQILPIFADVFKKNCVFEMPAGFPYKKKLCGLVELTYRFNTRAEKMRVN